MWHSQQRRALAGAAPLAGASPAASRPSAPAAAEPGAPAPPDVADLPAKLALLEAVGIDREAALRRYGPYLCSPAHHIAVRLAFLQSRGKLRRPPRLWQVGGALRGGAAAGQGRSSRGGQAALLWCPPRLHGGASTPPSPPPHTHHTTPPKQVICPSDAELCRLHGEEEAQLAAFKAEHLASPAWQEFCAAHSVLQAHPAAATAAAPTGQQTRQADSSIV